MWAEIRRYLIAFLDSARESGRISLQGLSIPKVANYIFSLQHGCIISWAWDQDIPGASLEHITRMYLRLALHFIKIEVPR